MIEVKIFKDIQETLSCEYCQKIQEGIRNHDKENAPSNLISSATSIILLENKIFVGGILFKARYKVLEIKYLYIDEIYRNKGYGEKLINEATDFAKKNFDITTIYLETFSFQAPKYYPKLGFQVDFIRSDYDNNIKRYYLKKKIN